MALVVAPVDIVGNVLRYFPGTGVNANDVVVQTGDVSRYDEFMISNTAGAVQMLASIDGVNYMTAPVSLQDLGSASLVVSVIVTAANRIYRVRGFFNFIRLTQNGATAATGVCLVCSRSGGQH